MNGNELFEKMSLIEDELIEAAETAGAKKSKKKERIRKRLGLKRWSCLAAACICVLIVSISMVEPWQNQNPKNTQQPSSDVAETGSISIPAIQLPKGDGEEYDMIGLIVYQGRIYTQVEWYEGEKATAIRGLVGERLGFAKGNIDEWSDQKDYAEEFAGTAYGDVYAVNGYSTQFRICIYEQYSTDESEEVVDHINFYENLNGISLTTGADLFEERLKMQENWKAVQYQTHESWNNALGEMNELAGITDTKINDFFTELNSAEFVDMTGTDIYHWTDMNQTRQTHLYVTLTDGTYVELRLLEGGYVGYQGLGWYFVKMPGNAFDLIFEACFQ